MPRCSLDAITLVIASVIDHGSTAPDADTGAAERGAGRGRCTGRRTNLALLVTVFAAFATGLTAQALGTPSLGRWAFLAHGVAGLAVALLAPWKSRVIRRGMARRHPRRSLSVLLAVLTVFVIVTGVLHSLGVPSAIGPFTLLWVHVVCALALVPLLIWHIVARKTTPRPADLTRRNFLRLGGLTSASVALWWGAAGATALAGLPGAARRFTGSHERAALNPEAMPVTSWLDDQPPQLDAATWRLTVDDASGGRTLGLADLAGTGGEDLEAVLDCTSGWYSRQRWSGVRMDRLVDPGEACSIVVWSATGYARRFPVADLGRLWLATALGDRPLSTGHGFPARLIAPDRRGFWWVKWVVRIETSPLPWWVQSPYPVT